VSRSRSPFLSPEQIEQQRLQAELDRLQVRQLREDIRKALEHQPTRSVLWVFLQTMGMDASPFNTNAMAQSRAIGRQEAALWWLEAIRDNCPEREAQMRAEANSAMKRLQRQAQRNEETDEHD